MNNKLTEQEIKKERETVSFLLKIIERNAQILGNTSFISVKELPNESFFKKFFEVRLNEIIDNHKLINDEIGRMLSDKRDKIFKDYSKAMDNFNNWISNINKDAKILGFAPIFKVWIEEKLYEILNKMSNPKNKLRETILDSSLFTQLKVIRIIFRLMETNEKTFIESLENIFKFSDELKVVVENNKDIEKIIIDNLELFETDESNFLIKFINYRKAYEEVYKGFSKYEYIDGIRNCSFLCNLLTNF